MIASVVELGDPIEALIVLKPKKVCMRAIAKQEVGTSVSPQEHCTSACVGIDDIAPGSAKYELEYGRCGTCKKYVVELRTGQIFDCQLEASRGQSLQIDKCGPVFDEALGAAVDGGLQQAPRLGQIAIQHMPLASIELRLATLVAVSGGGKS